MEEGKEEVEDAFKKKKILWAVIQMDADPESVRRNVWYSHSAIHRTKQAAKQPTSSTQRWLNIYLAKSLLLELYYSRASYTCTLCLYCCACECKKNKKMTTNKKNIASDRVAATE